MIESPDATMHRRRRRLNIGGATVQDKSATLPSSVALSEPAD